MSKVWEFALTPKRLTAVSVCLGLAGVVLAAAGFAAGVIAAPRVRSDLALVTPGAAAKSMFPKLAGRMVPAKAPAKPEASSEQPAAVKPALEASAPAPAPAPAPGPVPAPAAPKPADSAAAAAKPLPIQLDVRVASFTSDERARNTVTQLRDSGYPANDVPLKDASSLQWHVVEVGPYAAHEAASRTVLELSTKYGFSPVIVASRMR